MEWEKQSRTQTYNMMHCPAFFEAESDIEKFLFPWMLDKDSLEAFYII